MLSIHSQHKNALRSHGCKISFKYMSNNLNLIIMVGEILNYQYTL